MATRHIEGYGIAAGGAATELARIKGDTVGTGPVLYDAIDGLLKYYDRVNAAVRQLASLNPAPVSITANLSLTEALHVNRPLLLNAAAGFSAIVLPAATGTGNIYRLTVATLLTSNALVVDVAGSDKLYGGVIINDIGDTTVATADFHPAVNGSSVKFTLTASIGGGKIGDFVQFQDIGSAKWAVSGVIQGETDPTNPFS